MLGKRGLTVNKNKLVEFALEVCAHIVAIILATYMLAWLLPGLSH